MNFAIIGATGNVGRKTIEILEKSNIQISNLFLVASEKSEGKKIKFKGKEIQIESLKTYDFSKAQITFFAAGGKIAEEWVPKASKKTVVIDNSKVFRMDKDVPLIVPEVNPDKLSMFKNKNIIANPNCSTIQMVMALAPLHKLYGLKRLVISTYQSVTGSGVKAQKQLENEACGTQSPMAYPYQIYQNCLPHCDDFLFTGYTREEMKLVHETRKILGDQSIGITATAVRVPVMGGHSESINVTFKKEFDLTTVRKAISDAEGLILQDNTDTNTYPMPKYAEGKDDVFVGRLRRDESCKNTLNMWVVSDNLRKGAATNAVQIAEKLIEKELFQK